MNIVLWRFTRSAFNVTLVKMFVICLILIWMCFIGAGMMNNKGYAIPMLVEGGGIIDSSSQAKWSHAG